MKKKSLLLILLMALIAPWAAKAQTVVNCYPPTQEYATGYTDGSTKTSGEMHCISNGGVRGWMMFDVSSIPDGALINSIKLHFYCTSTSNSYVKLTSAGQLNPTTASASELNTAIGNETPNYFTETYMSGFGSTGWKEFTLSSSAVNALMSSGLTADYFTLGFYEYETWSGYSLYASGYDDETNKPYIEVSYSTEPSITLDPTSVTVFTGSTKNLTATTANVTGTPTITYSSSNTKVASVTGSGTSATVTGVSVGTATITATMIYNATDYTATCDVTVEDPSYCTPSFSKTSDYIASFTTTGGEQNINNTNTGQGTGGYSNFYDTHFVSAEPDTEIGFSVVRGYPDTYQYGLWVDWNKDYEFDNATELVASTTSGQDWSSSFTIPASTPAGDYRMRILQLYGSTATLTACASANYGEGEDYKLTVLAANPYQKPVNLQVSALTAITATITWEAPNSDVQSYKYQYREEGGTWTDLTTTTALSAPLTVLTGNTTYEFQVQAIYAGNNESGFASKTFTTLIAIPYEYGFEDATEFGKWETVDCEYDDSNYLSGVVTYAAYAHSGNNFFSFSSYNGATDPQYLISPLLSGIENGLHVSFYYRSADENDPETFMVGYSTTDTDPDSFTWSTEVTSPDDNYYPYAVNFMVPEIKYVAVKYTTANMYYLFVDDFTFEEAPNCLEPTGVNAINITTTTADITWTNGGDEDEWDIYATDDINDVPGDLTTPTVEGVTTKPYQLTLLPGTTYYVYVRAACSAKEHSAWSSPCSFHTDCEGMDLPYGPYGFEDGALTVCWNLLSTNVAYNTVSMNTTASYIHTGDYSLLMHSGSADGDFVLALPVIDDSYSLSDYRFVFWAMATNTDVKVTIGIMEDPNDMTTFVAQNEEFNPASEFTEYKVPFNGYTGDGQYVAIKVSRASSSSWGNVYIDDIAIELTPSCIEPSGLTVSNETAHGATFGWTAGGSETEWHLYFGEDNTAPDDDIALSKVTVADSNPFTLTTGLDPETEYYVWVRANCGGTDGYSMWVGPETFTTGIACPAPTGLAASEVTGHTAKLSWTGTSESYVLSVGTYDYTATPVTGTLLEEGFENTSMPEGWAHIGSGSAAPSTSYTHASSSRSLEFKSATSNNVVVLPQFTAEPNQLTIDFWSRAESNSLSQSGYFDLGYVTDASDASTFAILETYSAEDHGDGYVHVENYSLSSVPNGARIAFRHRSGLTYYYWYIDDVTITGPTYPIAWDTYNTTDTQKTVEDLDPETQYFAKVKGYCGTDDGYSQETAVISFTTDIACPAPTALTPSNPTSVSFDLSWNNGGASDWIVAYKKTTDTDFTEVGINMTEVTEEAGLITYTLGGLEAETDYIVKVRDNCEPSYTGDGVSKWTAEVPYSTIAACSAMNPVVDQASITHHTATVNWEGESATGFTVNYRTAEAPKSVFFEGFETYANEAALEAVWTVIDLGDGANTSELGLYSGAAKTDDYGFRFSSYNKASTTSSPYTSDDFDQYLISPELTVNGVLEFAYKSSSGTSDVFRVGYSSTTNDLSAFTWGDQINSANSWKTFSETMPAGTKYFAINYMGLYAHRLYIDDINIYVTNPAGAWQTQTATGTTADLTSLTSGTLYDLKVVPNCDETLESATVQFTTLVGNMKYFLTAGEWGTAANWMDEEIPAITDNATIRANVTIAKNYVAYAQNITRENSATITIKDGGELYHNNAVYSATMEKEIVGATTWGPGTTALDGWYVISNPLSYTSYTPTSTSYVTNLAPEAVGGVPQFDLYKYMESSINWYNYQAHSSGYYLTRGIGFLYSRHDNATISFMSGTYYSLPVADVTPTITYTAANGEMAGWNLLGNPFSHSITWDNIVSTNVNATGYYKLGFDGAWTTDPSTTTTIKPMEGFLVKATAASPTITIKNAAPSSKGRANDDFLAFTIANSNYSDITYAMFSDGEGLEKINHRNADIQMAYIPQGGERYAIATMGDDTEMFNLNFKAMTTGQYTLSYKAEGSFSYLHVIDRITGEDIDMLIEDKYTFIGSPRDDENRFIVKLSYNANGNIGAEDIFVYQNGEEIIVNGEGELQVFDVMGRYVASFNVNGNTRISASQFSNAVYIFRLIGSDVKTQKIVVR